MDKFRPIKVAPNQLNLSTQQIETIKQIGKELTTIQGNIPIIKEIVVRGGFTLDTVLKIEPHDIDLFYSLHKWELKDWQGCKCDSIKANIKKLDLPLINTRKVDLGHILKGEIYQEPIDKVIGIFSHHDINSRICFDKDGNIWTCKETINGIKNRIHEWDDDALLQFAYYPYMENDTYITFYSRNIIRGLRMIHTKKYIGVGPVFRSFVEKSPYLFDEILKDKKQTQILRNYILDKTDGMNLGDFQSVLETTGIKSRNEVIHMIEMILISNLA